MPSCLAAQQNHQWRHKVTLHEELQEDKSAALSPSSQRNHCLLWATWSTEKHPPSTRAQGGCSPSVEGDSLKINGAALILHLSLPQSTDGPPWIQAGNSHPQ